MRVYEVRPRKDRRAACYGTTICPITFVPVGAINDKIARGALRGEFARQSAKIRRVELAILQSFKSDCRRVGLLL